MKKTFLFCNTKKENDKTIDNVIFSNESLISDQSGPLRTKIMKIIKSLI